MDSDQPTVEMSLSALAEVVGKAATDYRAVREAIDAALANISSANTSLSRTIVSNAKKAVDHITQADEALRDVLADLAKR